MAASWECPPLPMISFALKDSSKAYFSQLKPLISSHYDESPESFSNEIHQLEQLRESALKPTRDYTGCNILRRYYAQIHLLKSRFPVEAVGPLPIDFSWKDLYTNADYRQKGLQIELASILYNIGALHSQLGSRDSRHTEQDMKESLTHYQCAAGAFAYLSEVIGGTGCADISPPLVDMYRNLMLGQAQECIIEKSLKGLSKVKNLNISKISIKVAQYYQSVVIVLESEVGAALIKKYKDWVKLLSIKSSYYTAVAHVFQANSMEEQGNYGYMIAFQQLAVEKVRSIGKLPRNTPDSVKDAVKNLTEYLTLKLQESLRQNEQVFHELVPNLETLEPAPGIELVKPVVFQPSDPKIIGTDIFSRLVPMRAYEAASLYSEEQAKLMRSVVSSVDEKNEELNNFMTSLNISEVMDHREDDATIPADIMSLHRQFQSKGTLVHNVKTKIQELVELSDRVEIQLTELHQRKEQEIQEEKEFQEKFDTKADEQSLNNLWKELESMGKYHKQASKSNNDLSEVFSQHSSNLLLFSGPTNSLVAAMPQVDMNNSIEESDKERVKMLLAKVDEMRNQRESLVNQLRQQMKEDDILHMMVGETSDNRDSVIADHLKTHRDLADIIRQNLTAQDNILKALTEANAKQAKTRQGRQQLKKKREDWCVGLAKSAGSFNFLQSKITEGLAFYTKLADSVSRLHKRTLETCNSQREKRQQIQKQNTLIEQAAVTLPPQEMSDHGTLMDDVMNDMNVDEATTSKPPGDDKDVTVMIFEMKRLQEEQQKALEATPTISNDSGIIPESSSIPTSNAPPPSRPAKPRHLQGEPTKSLTPDVGGHPVSIDELIDMTNDIISADDNVHPAIGNHSVITPGPISPIPVAPIHSPISASPIHPVVSEPVPQISVVPIIPMVTNPVSSIPAAPIHPVVSEPVPQISASPIHPVVSEPVPKLSVVPIIPMVTNPVSSIPASPIHPVVSEPVPRISASPIHPVVTESAHSVVSETVLPNLESVSTISPMISTISDIESSTGSIPMPSTGPIPIPSTKSIPIPSNGPIPVLSTGPIPIPSTGPIPVPSTGPIPIPSTGSIPIPSTGPIPIPSTGSISIPSTGPIPMPSTGPIPVLSTGPIPIPSTGSIPMPSTGPIPIPSTGPIPMPSTGSIPMPSTGPIPIPSTGPIPMSSSPANLIPITNTELISQLSHDDDTAPVTVAESLGFSENTFDDHSLHHQNISNNSSFIPAVTYTSLMPISHFTPASSSKSFPLLEMPAPPPHLSVTHPQSNTPNHLESVVKSQQEIIQSRVKQIDAQKTQIQQQQQQIASQARELEQFRLQQQLQEKDKVASSSNQSMLVQLLKQQQGLFSQQQQQIEKLNQEGELQRKQHSELEMKLRDALAQEQMQNQILHGQLNQHNKDVQHLQQQIQMFGHQIQSLQMQAQQYLQQINERDKVLANYREEHKQIIENIESQCRQKVQQITQQMQDFQAASYRMRGNESFKILPGNLPPPLQPKAYQSNSQDNIARQGIPTSVQNKEVSSNSQQYMQRQQPTMNDVSSHSPHQQHLQGIQSNYSQANTSTSSNLPNQPLQTGTMQPGMQIPPHQASMKNGGQSSPKNPRSALQGSQPMRQISQGGIQGPQPGIQGPQPGIQGPQPGIQGPQPGIQGPQPGIQGPQPGIQGPQPGIQGPQPGIQGPQPGIQGPQPGIQGPQPGIQGPQPGIQGPQSGMQGPQPGRQVPQTQPGIQGPQSGIQGGIQGPQPGIQGHQSGMQNPPQPGRQTPQVHPGMQGGIQGPHPGIQGGIQGPQPGIQGHQSGMQNPPQPGRQTPQAHPGMQGGIQGPHPGIQGGIQGPQPGIQGHQSGMQNPPQPGRQTLQTHPGMQGGIQGPQSGMQGGIQGPQSGMQGGIQGPQPGMQGGIQGPHPGIQGPQSGIQGGIQGPQPGMQPNQLPHSPMQHNQVPPFGNSHPNGPGVHPKASQPPWQHGASNYSSPNNTTYPQLSNHHNMPSHRSENKQQPNFSPRNN